MRYVEDLDYLINPYYSPGRLGLEIVDGMDYVQEPYEFHLFMVWLHKDTEKIFYGDDSGCSCPDPFAGYRVEQLTEAERWQDVQNKLFDLIGPSPEEGDRKSIEEWARLRGRAGELVSKVRKVMS